VRADGGDLRRLTGGRHAGPQEDWSPAWSPDGRTIAFTRNGVLHTMRRDGSDLRAAGRGEDVDWSPSGKRIVFAVVQRDGYKDLFTARADGSDRRRLTKTLGVDERTPAWSPQGGRIAFNRGWSGYLLVMRADGTDRHKILDNASDPAWSPRGGSLALSRAIATPVSEEGVAYPGAIMTLRLRGMTRRPVVSPRLDSDADMSPDGTRIAFTSYRPFSQSGIYEADPDGANETFLHTGYSPAWAPDGSQIVFRDGDASFVMDADGSDPIALPVPITAGGRTVKRIHDPDWRPDGAAVSFVGTARGCADVFTMELDGSNVQRVTGNGCYPQVQSHDWGPGGASVVFSGYPDCSALQDCNDQIFTASVPGGAPMALTGQRCCSSDGDPAISPDGTRIAFARDHFEAFFEADIWVMNADGSGKTKLTSTRSDYDPGWWP